MECLFLRENDMIETVVKVNLPVDETLRIKKKPADSK